jgi:hypothetical protein
VGHPPQGEQREAFGHGTVSQHERETLGCGPRENDR